MASSPVLGMIYEPRVSMGSACALNHAVSPSRLIFPRICRSAEQETPMPTGQEAPWRGSRITRTSWQKYLPPN